MFVGPHTSLLSVANRYHWTAALFARGGWWKDLTHAKQKNKGDKIELREEESLNDSGLKYQPQAASHTQNARRQRSSSDTA